MKAAAKLTDSPPPTGPRNSPLRWGTRVLATALGLWLHLTSQAAIQFDVFVGYDGVIREAGWFPVLCEVLNDAGTFRGTIEITAGRFGTEQTRQIQVELPNNTRKRIVLPVFSTGNRFANQWDVRLLDEKGKVRAERVGLTTKNLSWEGILLGALPRSFAGMPLLPDVKLNRAELKPQVARMQPEQVPDNPIALEGLDAFYLNSEKAADLKVTQVNSLVTWVRNGGHLIIGVEQIADVTASPWLRQLAPINLTGSATPAVDDALISWVKSGGQSETVEKLGALPAPRSIPAPRPGGNRAAPPAASEPNPYESLPTDPGFLGAQMPVATGILKDGTVLISAGGIPLAIEADRGRGHITFLTFSPEREPFRSWKGRSFFWARVLKMPSEWFYAPDFASYGGWSIDGVFGALIDSRQVKKLPVKWLLALLVIYLIVIGPFDHYWLKKINRQMLTWITFPSYVLIFSLLIYFIGYKLRAGENEWNELHIVDILPRNEGADLRGRTYASIYSAANAHYPLASEQPFAALRGELLDLMGGGGKESSRATVVQQGNSFRAEVYVPVWTSMLYECDWLQQAALPFKASVIPAGENHVMNLENLLDRPLTHIRVVVQGAIYEVGTLAASEKKAITLLKSQGVSLRNFIQQNGSTFQAAVDRRKNPLGDDRLGRLEDGPLTATVASFSSQIAESRRDFRGFVAPAGFDLTPQVRRGDAVILAWDAGHSLAAPLNKFTVPRMQKNTLLRLAIPIQKI